MKKAPIFAALALSLVVAGNVASAQAPSKGKPANASAATTMSYKDAKLAAIDAWLTANKTAPDRADALSEAANLAFELSNWSKAKGYAETYVKEFPKADSTGEMQLMVGQAVANTPGGEVEAKKIFEKLVADAGEDARAAYGATNELVDLTCSLGDIEGTKQALKSLVDKFPKVQEIKGYADDKLAEIEQFGSAPKAIDVLGFDGKPINLDDLKGKVVMIDFWATWCHPCMLELPNVIATYKKLHPKGFEIVGISLDSDEAKLKEFLASHKEDVPWAQFYDGKGWKNEISTLYGVNSIPQTYLLDQDGKIQGVGLRGAALGRAAERLLASKGAAKK